MNREKIFSSLVWKLLERAGIQSVSFIVSLILARLLTPSDYGLISLIIVFINLANVFIQGGFNTALIQKKNTDDKDFSSVFYFSLFIAFVLYIILFLFAPTISRFYNEEQLIKIIRVLSIILFIGSFNSIQVAYVTKKMEFKRLFISSIGATVISAIIGIGMAMNGFGVWALVCQQISNQLCTVIIMWFTVPWRPKLIFSIGRLKNLLSYGWKILLTNLTNTLFLNLRSLLIGKIYTPDMLGYFNRGRQFPEMIMTNVNGSIQSVMLVAYSNEQDNKQRIKEMVRRSMTVSSFIIFPMMFGLVVVAEPVVKILLTDKWLPAVPFIQICAFTYMLMPIHTTNLQAIKAMGYSNIILKLEIIRKILELSVLIFSVRLGVYAIAIGEVVTTIISLGINLYPNKKLINYGVKEQMKDITPSFFNSVIMAVIVYSLKFLSINVILKLIIQILTGVIVYITLSNIFNVSTIKYLSSLFKGYFNKNNKYLRKGRIL